MINNRKICIIYHCEHSKYRGPIIATKVKAYDQNLVSFNSTTLHTPLQCYYPESYVMKGGYEQFSAKYPNLCIPKGCYISMLSNKKLSESLLMEFKFREKNKSNNLTTLKRSKSTSCLDIRRLKINTKHRAHSEYTRSNFISSSKYPPFHMKSSSPLLLNDNPDKKKFGGITTLTTRRRYNTNNNNSPLYKLNTSPFISSFSNFKKYG